MFLLYANTCHSLNAVLILTHSLRRWSDIETTLGDCTMFLPAAYCYAVTLFIMARESPDNTIHWANADVMLGQWLRRWANIIPTKTL